MTVEKTCTKCGVVKTTNDFAKYYRSKDGLQNECKECKANRYRLNRDAIRLQQKSNWVKYSEKNSTALKEKNRKRRIGTKEKDAAYREMYKTEFAPKIAAKNAIWSNLLTGKIVRKPCEECGNEITDAHHDDYSEPLNVRWLCRRHHAKWHAENGEALNGRAIEAAVRAKQ